MKRHMTYVTEFFVIVIGITSSFLVDEYRQSLQSEDEGVKVLESLRDELKEIESYCEHRKGSYDQDFKVLANLLGDRELEGATYSAISESAFQIQIAVYDYRGFEPPMVRYQSIVSEGTLKHVRSESIKNLVNELNTSYLSTLQGNIAQEKELAFQIVKRLSDSAPKLITDYDGVRVHDAAYIKKLHATLQRDPTLKALLALKLRFIKIKRFFLGVYLKVCRELQTKVGATLGS